MKHPSLGKNILSCVIAATLFGCATGGGTKVNSQASFDENYSSGNFSVAAEQATEKARINKDGVGKDLLWSLKAADAWRAAGEIDKSNTIFDGTAPVFSRFDDENFAKKHLVDNASAILVNDKVVAYKGTFYDSTMVNTYMAMNFVGKGDWGYARVELNRALERQSHAENHFKDLIEKDRAERKEELKADAEVKIDSARSEAEIAKLKQTVNAEMEDWPVSPNYVNPFATYLSGILFYLNAEGPPDREKARDSLKEANDLIKKNEKITPLAKSYLERDLKVVESGETAESIPPTVWVIFENGLAPIKKEKRIDLPLFLVTENVLYTGIAYPTLEFRQTAYPFITVLSNGKEYKSATIANMDALISKEFQTEFPGIMTRAIVSATAKTIAQYQIKKKYGGVAGFGAALLQVASTQADLRIWSTLPKEFQLARVPRPETGVLTIQFPQTDHTMTVPLPGDRHNIVYLKMPTRDAVPVLTAMALGDSNGPSRTVARSEERVATALAE